MQKLALINYLTRRIARLATVAIFTAAFLGLASIPALSQSDSIDRTTSDALTGYLHKHRLPMVGAQVSATGGGRQVMLYGFVATDFGKRDAERKALSYLRNSDASVVNRIVVNPKIRHLKTAPPKQPDEGDSDEADMPPQSTDWENKMNNVFKQGGVTPSNDPSLMLPN